MSQLTTIAIAKMPLGEITSNLMDQLYLQP